MKPTLLVLALFPFLLFSMLVSAVDDQNAELPDPVRDTSGKILRAGNEYHILPVLRGPGGGLTLASTRNKTCPLDVVQEPFDVLKGLPVTFSPVDPKKGVIRVSTDLNIKFSASAICAQSSVWRLLKELTGVWFVSSGGVEGNPGMETTVNWFKIEKDGDDYNFAFCPSVCESCKVLCDNLGIFIDEDGKRHLALADSLKPFKVFFQKVPTSAQY
ncbi:Kunitz type trypsin inhibitor / miraculin [Quillaja saponaria]|uniref:Kunitz type trypsin inhibitor / miraculin n=1 Tax=Quillaja saponaria TaxID=32244 RepID=A0AAD7M534_QUISA|nr:Kunitz type trypsin inhibitor / miraculin [Quillaja saponaria]